MDVMKALVLGAIQGFTEFLPVSSSGHLAIGRELLQAPEALVAFDIFVHLGTLVAVLVAFRRDVLVLIRAASGIVGDLFGGVGLEAFTLDEHRRLACLIILASLPAAVMGMVLKSLVYALFSSMLAVGVFLLATGLLLWFAERRGGGGGIPLEKLDPLGAVWIGVAQGFAIAPGFSRSGATISAGLLQGLRRDDAARFSFLLSIPVILGAGIVELVGAFRSEACAGAIAPFLLGFLASTLSGYLAIRLLLQAVKGRKLTIFAVYTWVVGTGAIVWGLMGR